MPYTESSYENAIIQLFEEMGYTHAYGPDVVRDYKVPYYADELTAALYRLNPSLPDDAISDALYKLTNYENGELVQKNAVFMDYLQNGVEVRYTEKGEERSALCYLVDYSNIDNNSFVVANQWTYIENAEKRPDVLLFINGLPVVLMELKSPSREETDASEAYTQIRNYMHAIPSMFIYNAICVMSDLSENRAGTITSGEDRFMEWKTKDGSYESTQYAQFDTFFEGIFQKERLLDILKNFILFSNEGLNQYKILAGYHQYFAVRKAVESTKKATVTDGKGGVFWHTQGSGKSLSMVFYAHLLQSELESPTIVVITDRNDLDDQLYSQFAKCKDFLRQEPVHAESREHLKSLLEGKKANGIIFTTMQKFEESGEPLSERRNIIVMADEAHRGQYGLTEKIKMTKNEKGELVAKKVIGTARIIRDTLPNATYIGFTGTPIATEDRNTREVFGDYIDIYDMTQAVEDGATRPVYYESRVMKLKLDETTLRLIDTEYDIMAQSADPDVIEKSKRELGQMEAILGHDDTIKSLVDDILDHYTRDVLNRDDIIDITDFDVVQYQYGIMRELLNEELALAIMISDGRDDDDPDKISEDHIRSIWHDKELYTIHFPVTIDGVYSQEIQRAINLTGNSVNYTENYKYAEALIAAALISREKYKGTGKGYDYAIKGMTKDLQWHFRRHGNKGYILLFDFKKFFENVSHAVIKADLNRKFNDERLIKFGERSIDSFGDIGLGLGNQDSQIWALDSANRLDHFIKEVLGVKCYRRYMDDGYLIHESKEFLVKCLEIIKAICQKLDITLNEKKTQIVKLSHGFKWLKVRFFLTKTGKVVRKIYKRSLTRMRRKLKALHRKYIEGITTFAQVVTSFQCWLAYAIKFHSYHTRNTLISLFDDLFTEEMRYRKWNISKSSVKLVTLSQPRLLRTPSIFAAMKVAIP